MISSLILSAGMLIGSQSADAWTTLHPQPGTYETNPLGVRGVIVEKAISTGVLLTAEYFIVRHHPNRAKWFAILNGGLTVEFGWSAWHNETLK